MVKQPLPPVLFFCFQASEIIFIIKEGNTSWLGEKTPLQFCNIFLVQYLISYYATLLVRLQCGLRWP